MAVVVAMLALAVDVSRFYLLRRQQQAAGDLAAIAAAANLGDPRAAALASLAANGRPPSDLVALDLGTYAADPTIPAAARFTAGGAPANAARVTLRSIAPAFFGGLLSPVSSATGAPTLAAPAARPGASLDRGAVIVTRSTAASQNTASFALGSRLAALDGGAVNAVLGGLLGTRLTLSILDYQGLASAGVDLFGLYDALALRLNRRDATYGALAALDVRFADLVAAAADAGAAGHAAPGAVQALRLLAQAVGNSGPVLAGGSLASFGAYGGLAVGSGGPLGARLPVLPLLTAAARLAAGQGVVTADLGTRLPGLLAASVRLAVGAAPVGASYATVGPSGTVLHTAQVRLLLTVQLGGERSIAGVNLPLYVEVAPATARLAAVTCPAGPASVTLGVTPGVVDGWIGAVTDSALASTAYGPVPDAAVLTTALGLGILGRAHATVSNLSESLVVFSPGDIAAGAGKTVSTTDVTASLLSRLFASLQLGARVSGGSIALPAEVTGPLAHLLQAAAQPIDTELSVVLSALGLTIGDADTWVGGARCGQGALVD